MDETILVIGLFGVIPLMLLFDDLGLGIVFGGIVGAFFLYELWCWATK